MKTAKEWLEDARLAHKFEGMIADYDIYNGELESLAGAFWQVQLDNMQMAGLEQNEYEACEAFVTSDNVAEAAAKMDYSEKWFATIIARARKKIDHMLSVSTKYCNFKGASVE